MYTNINDMCMIHWHHIVTELKGWLPQHWPNIMERTTSRTASHFSLWFQAMASCNRCSRDCMRSMPQTRWGWLRLMSLTRSLSYNVTGGGKIQPYIPDIPYFPNMPYQTGHTHHTYPTYHATPPPHHREGGGQCHNPTTPQGGKGEDLIWGQYMGPIPWGGGGVAGLGAYIYIYIYMHMFSCWFRFTFSFVFVDRFICLYSISLVDIDVCSRKGGVMFSWFRSHVFYCVTSCSKQGI